MKTSPNFLLKTCFAISLLLGSCGGSEEIRDYSKEVDEGGFKGDTYTSDLLGWSITFPDTWKVTLKSSLEATSKLNDESKEISEPNNIKRLLAYQKNFDNNFQSTIEPFSGKTQADYLQARKNLREQIYYTYLDNRSSLDTLSSSVTFDGLQFDCFQINLYDKQGTAFAHQLLYSRLLSDHYFTIIINYDNEKDRDKMIGTLKKSKFLKRK